MKKKKEGKDKRRITVRGQWKEAKKYLGESKGYIYSMILIFIASTLIGYFNVSRLGFLDELLKNIVSKTIGLNPLELIFFILQNNLQSALLGFLLGIFLGIFPVINAVTNGAVLGYVLARTQEVAGISQFWRVLPHGIFELPAVFIALGLGIRFGFFIFNGNPWEELKRRFYSSINVFLMVVVPLLIIAAIIEGILIALGI